MIPCTGFASVGVDFHSLWKQAQFAVQGSLYVQLFQDASSHKLFVKVVPTKEGVCSSLELLLSHIRPLLESTSASCSQVKGALKLMQLFAKCIEPPSSPVMPGSGGMLTECTVTKIRLLEKLASLEGTCRSLVQIGCECGCPEFVLESVCSNISLFMELSEPYSFVVLGHLIVERNVPILVKMMLEPSISKRVSEQFIASSVQDDELLQRLVDELWSISAQSLEKQKRVVLLFSELVQRGLPVLGRKIGEKIHHFVRDVHPDEVVLFDASYAKALCSKHAFQGAGFGSSFFAIDQEVATSEEKSLRFLNLSKVQERFPGIQRTSLPRFFNVIAVAIWLKLSPSEIAPIFSCKEFEIELEKLRGYLPNAIVDEYLFSAWNTEREHLKEVCFEPPPYSPPGVSVGALLEEYGKRVSESQTVQLDGKSCFISKAAIELLIGRIVRREFFIGTPPPATSQLLDYYATLEMYLCHTIALLKAKGDQESWLRCFKEYAEAADQCGGRYFATITAEYYKVSLQGNSSKDKILRSLAQFRRIWFEQTVLPVSFDHNPNPLNCALRAFGTMYGIPGARAALHFEDPYGERMCPATMESSFVQTYRPSTMVQWLQEAAKDDEMRGALIDHYVERPPIGWQRERYSEIYDQVEKINALDIPLEQKKERTTAYLHSVDIDQLPGKSVQESILEAQRHDFLERYFFDASHKIRTVTLLHILKDLKAISTPLQDADFLSPAEESSADGVVGLFQKIGAIVLSWF